MELKSISNVANRDDDNKKNEETSDEQNEDEDGGNDGDDVIIKLESKVTSGKFLRIKENCSIDCLGGNGKEPACELKLYVFTNTHQHEIS